MAPNLTAIIDGERVGIVAEIGLTQILPIVALNDIGLLHTVPGVARWKAPATVRPLNSQKPGDGWVLDCPTLKYKSFWALAADNDYRDHYKAFLLAEHHYAGPLPDDLHVDHLYNRARALMYGLKYIRMFLLPQSPNTSHGGGYEASITVSEAKRDVSDIRKMDEIVFMKFMGMKSPRVGKSLTAAQQQHLKAVAASTGIDFAELVGIVQRLMQKANSGWAA